MPKGKPPQPGTYRVHVEYSYRISDGDDKAIAHVDVYERMAGLWVTNLWVKNDLRGQGLGRKVMERMIDDLGRWDLFLNVSPYAGDTLNPEQLVAFYETFGFVMSAINGIMFRRGRRKDG